MLQGESKGNLFPPKVYNFIHSLYAAFLTGRQFFILGGMGGQGWGGGSGRLFAGTGIGGHGVRGTALVSGAGSSSMCIRGLSSASVALTRGNRVIKVSTFSKNL